MRILYITSALPYPPDSGVRIRDFNLIKRVSEHHSVSVLSLLEYPEEVENIPALAEYCDSIDVVPPYRKSAWQHLKAISECIAAGRPLVTHNYFYKEMASKIHNTVSSGNFDIVQIEHSFLAPYIKSFPANSRCNKILSFHNV